MPQEVQRTRGQVVDRVEGGLGLRLMCDGEVAIKGKGLLCVWRLERKEDEQGSGGAREITPRALSKGGKGSGGGGGGEGGGVRGGGGNRGEREAQERAAGSNSDASLFHDLVQRQAEIKDEGSAMARNMAELAAQYVGRHRSVGSEDAPSTTLKILESMLFTGSEFERLYLCYKAPHLLPVQIYQAGVLFVHAVATFSVDVVELGAARERGEDGIDFLIGVGILNFSVQLAVLIFLIWLGRARKCQRVVDVDFLP